MKILYHHRTQGTGVEKVHILGIVNAWRRTGYIVDVVSPMGVNIEESKQKNTEKEGWSKITKELPELCFELLEVIYNFWAIVILTRRVKKKRYDLLYERYSFLCFAGLLIAKIFHIPYFLEVNYTSRTPIVRKRSFLIKKIERWIEKLVFQKADGIICVSSYLKRNLVFSSVSEEKIMMLPNAANPRKFNHRMKSDAILTKLKIEGNLIIGFIGYFYKWHGVNFLIETFPVVKKRVKSLKYVLIGDGETFSDISEMVIKNNWANDILPVGRVHHEEIQDYISVFDIAVMPNSNNYGSPMKILEYMAMGKAIVAPRLEPIEDVIDHKRNGLLFEPNNFDQFCNKLIYLATNSEIRKKLGEAARSKIIQKHNWERNSEKIIKLYQKLNYKEIR